MILPSRTSLGAKSWQSCVRLCKHFSQTFFSDVVEAQDCRGKVCWRSSFGLSPKCWVIPITPCLNVSLGLLLMPNVPLLLSKPVTQGHPRAVLKAGAVAILAASLLLHFTQKFSCLLTFKLSAVSASKFLPAHARASPWMMAPF